MSSNVGTNLRVQVFGQSHSAAIGCVVEGLPAGFAPDLDALQAFMDRRAPGRGIWSTPRREADKVEVVSGLNQSGETCGAPLAAIIRNTSQRSSDYDELARIPRPGHADWPAHVHWGGSQDVAGGGHFSGRLTAPLCIAGGIAMQVLATRGVRVAGHALEVAGIADEPFDARATDANASLHLQEQMDALDRAEDVAVISNAAREKMIAAVREAREQGDSVGGIVECVACGMPAGLGDPAFDGIESLIARLAFGVGGLKGLQFGAGFEAARMRGSEHNDPYRMVDGAVRPAKNDAGGNLGGLTTGAPVLFSAAFKPTSSISLPQDSVDLTTGDNATLGVRGRHDPCIALRAVPVMEAITALALLDALLAPPATMTELDLLRP